MDNYLLRQVRQSDQTRGRRDDLRADFNKGMILYRPPGKLNMTFRIDTSPLLTGGEPKVTCEQLTVYSASHRTHTLGGGRACLASSLRGWELSRILYQIDSWVRGYEIYKETGKFPNKPSEVFVRKKKDSQNKLTHLFNNVMEKLK